METNQQPTKEIVTSLVSKLIAIYEAVDHVEKRGFNKFQQYGYVKASDIARAIRDALKTQKVFAVSKFTTLRYYTVPTKDKDEVMQAVDLECVIDFVDADSGYGIKVNGFGSGTDKGDKAVYKAMTGAMKYALRSAFMIPDESDPEADEETDRQTQGRPQSGQAQVPPKGTPTQLLSSRHQSAAPNTPTTAIPAPPAHDPAKVAPQPIPVSATPAVTPAVSTPTADPNGLPTKEQYDAYINRAVKLTADLEKAGLKAGQGLPTKTKLKKYIFHAAKVNDLKSLSVAQWDTLFEGFEKVLSTGGDKELIGYIEKANAKEGK